MNHKEDLIGRKFNRLTVIAYAEDYVSPRGKHWTNCLCKCDCGATHIVRASSLKSGAVKSCGCLNREKAGANLRKHGFSHRDPLYTVWKGMRERCTNPRQTCWNRYGGRGIKVCAEWDDFMAFREWALSNGWLPRLTIDRIDNDKGYSPDNCRIVTFKENNNHRGHYRDEKGRYVLCGDRDKCQIPIGPAETPEQALERLSMTKDSQYVRYRARKLCAYFGLPLPSWAEKRKTGPRRAVLIAEGAE